MRGLKRSLVAGMVVMSCSLTVFADLDDGLAGWWKLDEGSGSAASDASGGAGNGVLVGFPGDGSGWVAGHSGGNALRFTGGYVRVSTASVFNFTGTKNFSVSFWFRFNTLPSSTAYCMFVTMSQKINGLDEGWYIMYGGNTNKIIFDRFRNAQADYAQATGFTTGQWYHVVAVWDGSKSWIYVNNVPSYSVITSPKNIRTVSCPLTIGATSSGWGSFNDAVMDDVRIYDRALSSLEVAALYDPALIDPGNTAATVTLSTPTTPLPSWTSHVKMTLTTDKPALCRMSTTPGVDFEDMPIHLGSTPRTKFYYDIDGLTPGSLQRFYVRSQNTALQENGADTTVTVDVQPDAYAFGGTRYDLHYAVAPASNPLKGIMASDGTSSSNLNYFPHSLISIVLPMKTCMTGPDTFDWTVLEQKLETAKADGSQIKVQFWMDYPNNPTGIPQFLLDGGLVTTHYNDFQGAGGLSVSPDYENAALRKATTDFITAFGAAYDGDERIGFIQLCLLGMWGEWHTNNYHEVPFASKQVQTEVMDAFEQAFTKTKLLVRYPVGDDYLPGGPYSVNGPNSPYAANDDRRIGYHDDMFGRDTDSFMNMMNGAGPLAVNKWKNETIGGEFGGSAERIFDTYTDAFMAAIETTHASWDQTWSPFYSVTTPPGIKYDRAIAAARRLGYEFNVVSITTLSDGPDLKISVCIRNMGVAPFYYDWKVEVAAADDAGNILKTWEAPWNISSLLPGAPVRWGMTLDGVPAGKYRLLMHVVNPMAGGRTLHFANTGQNTTRWGWLTLCTIDPSYVPGDVTGDGTVAADDAALAAQCAVGSIVLTDEQYSHADADGDGEVTGYDAALISARAAGLMSLPGK